MTNKSRPIVLIVLDGWGHTDESESNAIQAASKPVWDRLWGEYPHTLLRASGAEVGLPAEQMGNSEVGHLNLGAGRVVYQEFTRVSRSIRTGSFYSNRTLTDAVDQAAQTEKALHILGLLSPGGVHSHECQIHAMIKLAAERGAKKIYLHAFLDGRDRPPKSAMASILAMEEQFKEIGQGRFASLIGRFYAMDRDHRWQRIQKAYDLITTSQAAFTAERADAALSAAYERGESDEFVQATCIVPLGQQPIQIEKGDVLLSMNFRSDRARQLTRAFIEKDFQGFERTVVPHLASFVSLTEYNKTFNIPVAFPPERLKNTFGEYISNLGLRQLRLAETEKYAHVTFFFNGGREEPFEGEDRILIPSPHCDTYDLKPEMNSPEVTDHLVAAICEGRYDAIVCNYANCDMVGHTGNFEATIQAVEAIDLCLGRVVKAIHRTGGELLITADHGNAEKMRSVETEQAHTAHTTNSVPLIYVGRSGQLANSGVLSDVTPTMLYLMGLESPSEMSGHSLVELDA